MARRMLLILLIPLIGLGGFAATIVRERQQAVAELEQASNAVASTTALGELVMALGDEVAWSTLAVVGVGETVALEEARTAVDDAVARAAATGAPTAIVDDWRTRRADVGAGAASLAQLLDRGSDVLDELVMDVGQHLLRTLRGLLWLKDQKEPLARDRVLAETERLTGGALPGVRGAIESSGAQGWEQFQALYADVEKLAAVADEL